jgi:ankyrin repeat protein
MDLFDMCERDPEELKRLVEKQSIDVNTQNYINGSLLHYASWKQPSLVEFLIEKGANVNAKSASGNTPLHWAESRKAIELLLKHGADIHASNIYGQTPIHYSNMLFGQSMEAIRVLYEHGSRLPPIHSPELNKIIALFAGMCWKRSRVGGLPSNVLIAYLITLPPQSLRQL